MKTIHVVIGAGTWKQDGLRYRRHRLAEFLASRPETQRVFWLCPSPRPLSNRRIGKAGKIEQWAVTDVLPQKVFRFGRYLSHFHKRRLNEFVGMLESLDKHNHVCLWYTFPGFPILKDLFPWDRVIYDRSDLWAAPISGRMSFAAKMRQRVIAQAERQIVNRADLIFCTSDYLHKETVRDLPAEKADRVRTIENGVDYRLFSKNAELFMGDTEKTVLGYIGGIKPKLDFALLNEVARRRPEWQILLVGPDGTQGDPEFARLLERDNVLWIGAVPPNEVPHYMRRISIGLMPYKASPYNSAVFPLKLFEFLAAGKAAVGVHLPSTKKYEQDSVYTCLTSSEPEQLIQVCEHLEKVNVDPEAIHKRKELAQLKDWSKIFEEMLRYL